MEVSVLDYGAGNVGSVIRMLEKSGAKAFKISTKEEILNAKKLILPGVGSFDYGIQRLIDRDLVDSLNLLKNNEVPILGICLGMQMMCKNSEEGSLKGLGWFEAEVKKFDAEKFKEVRIPHMGWNTVDVIKQNKLIELTIEEIRFYFVHSFYVACKNQADIIGYTLHGNDFVSVMNTGNVWGVQFHPEKSHRFGMTLMKNFINM